MYELEQNSDPKLKKNLIIEVTSIWIALYEMIAKIRSKELIISASEKKSKILSSNFNFNEFLFGLWIELFFLNVKHLLIFRRFFSLFYCIAMTATADCWA